MKTSLCIALLFTAVATPIFAQEKPQTPAEVATNVTAAAETLINSVDDLQKQKLLFAFDDETQRRNWSNLPNGNVPRNGLRWGDLNETQQAAVMRLLSATLSPMGVQQVVDNMNGDEVLKNGSGGRGRRQRGRGPDFGKDAYYVAILGTPSKTEPWMWMFGGHHLGINATIAGEQITLSPSLTGGQPVDYELDGRPVRQLGDEEDKAFEFVGSLRPEQRPIAVLDGRYHAELNFGPGRDNVQPEPEGISAAKLDDAQKKLLLELIEKRVSMLNDVHAKLAMDIILEHLDETWFAWFGPTEPGAASSFRIQGPTVLIEYAPQHLGGDGTNHTHAMYRDPTNDYGASIIEKLSKLNVGNE